MYQIIEARGTNKRPTLYLELVVVAEMPYIQTLSLILSQSSLSLVAQYIGLCPNTIIHGYLARFSGLLASCNYIRNDMQNAQGSYRTTQITWGQGRIYVADECPIFERTITIFSGKLRISRQSILNRRQICWFS